LEGFRRLKPINAHFDKCTLKASLAHKRFFPLSKRPRALANRPRTTDSIGVPDAPLANTPSINRRPPMRAKKKPTIGGWPMISTNH
jgi:hypothetical protein